MNIRDITYFVAVAEHAHFGKAAAQCCVSQPTLSGQLKKLEAELGIRLFERTNRRVMLTDAGRQLLPMAQRVLRDVMAIQEIAESTKDPLSGRFRLGAFPTLASYIFPQLVPDIKTRMPKLRLILMEEKTAILIEKLHHGELDAALLALPIQDDYLVAKPLFKDEFLLAVPKDHELANGKEVEQSCLSKHSLLLLEEGHCLRDQALDVCQLHGIGEDQEFKATSLETLRHMVRAGTGITFMPSIAAKDPDPEIVYLPFKAPAPTRTIGLVWRKTSARMSVIERLLDIANQCE
jgi:LysR family hydrogen peroxide-inducible transcriptional activator